MNWPNYTPHYTLLGLCFVICWMGLKWFFCGLRRRALAAQNMALLCDYAETLLKLQQLADQIQETSTALVRMQIQHLIDRGAVHRKGYKLAEVPTERILVGAADELQELRDAPDDIEELADTLMCLMHYQIRKGWGQKELVAAMLHKLAIRFTIPTEGAT